ncbi:hypothetical protein VOLCADRAFT_106862 [Volvox carteri f. nagariensis]|uniref:Uncharacterized protein n=1 Tax=Volvox carteri f. nagariensis TaxID=3068 RepID=D8UA86_VOLCA|nr:uncharacterized protein VOLCADRAFT_106862 [Volvox carteri f. nagariensis]EFJ43433.1 hypothetical protein VOLCADRAFT_106862 [Volvox carteri f. nagariensis]|eukprot:XP_002955580.1 hypothetical protein VOLCADRAFT_106862 [Volvox carteri f. nagariensis]
MMWLLSAIAFIPVVFLLLTLTSIIWSAEEPTEELADAEVQGVGDGTFDDSEYDDSEYGGDDWEDGSAGEYDDADEADLADVVQQLAEMATLGMGCEDEIYLDPRNLHAFYELESAYFEEMPFRVQL